MRFYFLFLLFLPFLANAQSAPDACCSGKCTGEMPCSACTNCSGCRHCSKEGGSCGACAKKPTTTSTKTDIKTAVIYQQAFAGKIRAKAKTSISNGKLLTYATVGDFLKSLPTDSYMRKQGIGNSSPRTRDENYNIAIREAYIFYVKREEDNDVHVVIGDIIGGAKSNLLTIEISGLPATQSADYQTLSSVRKTFFEQFPTFFSGEKKSWRPKKPYPKIAVQGSLFFDNWHYAETEDDTRPATVFEIHPVTKVEFLK